MISQQMSSEVLASQLRDGWTWVTLEELVLSPKSDIVDGPFGSNLKASEYVNSGVPLVRLQNIDRNKFISDNLRFVTPTKADQLKRHTFLPGDILITKLGDPLGKACIVPDNIASGVIVADVVRLRIDHSKAFVRYISYCINSPLVAGQLSTLTKGTTRPRVNLGHIRQLVLPIPSLDEQRRIVSKLDELLSDVEYGTKLLFGVSPVIEKYRKAILQSAFNGKLTNKWRKENVNELCKTELSNPLPYGWEMVCMPEISSLITKGASPRWQGFEYLDNGIMFIRSQNVRWGSLDTEDVAYVDESLNQKQYRSIIREGDVLVNLVGASIGRAALATAYVDGANTNQAVGIIRPSSKILNKFLMYYLLSPQGQAYITHMKSDVARANFNLDDIRMMPVPLPPIEEQIEIVSRITKYIDSLATIENAISSTINKSQRLRGGLLSREFRREL